MGSNKKEIERILRNSLNELKTYVSRKNSAITDEFEKHAIVMGGSIVSLLLGEEINDIDIWFDDVDVCRDVICCILNTKEPEEYNIQSVRMSEGIPWTFEDKKLHSHPGYLKITENNNPNVISVEQKQEINYYDNSPKKKKGDWYTCNALSLDGGKYQIVTRVCGSPMDIASDFDFMHCVSYFSFQTGLVLNKFALESILTKELKYIGHRYPVSSFIRMNKFLAKGWRISNEDILKICFDISQTDLTVKKSLLTQCETFGMSKLFENLQPGYDRKEIFDILSN